MQRDDMDLIEELLKKEENPQIEREDINPVNVQPEELPAPIIQPAPEPDIKTRVYTNYPFLKEFLNDDFNIEQPTLVDLNHKENNNGYWFILFFEENNLGRNYLQLWLELAQIIKGDYINLGYCNMTFEKKIFENFKTLSKLENLNHPFHWAKFVELPFMLVYRDHWPQGFYNGPLYQQALIDYISRKGGDGLVALEKTHLRRINLGPQILESEKRLEEKELREKAEEEDKKKQEEIKEIDPRTQEISEGLNFADLLD